MPPTPEDSEEEMSVESNDLAADDPDYLQIWVDEGDWDRAARFAFVELEPAAAAAIPASCIRSAFLSVAPALHF